MIGETKTVLQMVCPTCGTAHANRTEMTNTQKPQPKPGDWAVCFKCAQICRYTANGQGLQLIAISDQTLATFPAAIVHDLLIVKSAVVFKNLSKNPTS